MAESVTEAAGAVAHLVRYLNNATRQQAALPYTGTVSDVVDSLAVATYRLDQLLEQLITALAEHRDHGRLYDDQDPDQSAAAGAATATAAIELPRAGDATAAQLAVVLQQAHSATSRLGHRDS